MASKSGSCFGSSDDQENKIVPSLETTKADRLAKTPKNRQNEKKPINFMK